MFIVKEIEKTGGSIKYSKLDIYISLWPYYKGLGAAAAKKLGVTEERLSEFEQEAQERRKIMREKDMAKKGPVSPNRAMYWYWYCN
jgi:hypothetical protein